MYKFRYVFVSYLANNNTSKRGGMLYYYMKYQIDDKRGDDLTYQNLSNFQDENCDNFGKNLCM